MKKVPVVVLFLVLAGCYEDSINQIDYFVAADDAVVIEYVPEVGGDFATVVPEEIPWTYSFTADTDSPVYYGVVVRSVSGEPVNMFVGIRANGEKIGGGWWRNTAEWVHKAYWCPPDCTSCARVRVGL